MENELLPTIIRTSNIVSTSSLNDDWNTIHEISFHITHHQIQYPEIIIDQAHDLKFETHLQQELLKLLHASYIDDFLLHSYTQAEPINDESLIHIQPLKPINPRDKLLNSKMTYLSIRNHMIADHVTLTLSRLELNDLPNDSRIIEFIEFLKRLNDDHNLINYTD